jgi:hypothetical protein
MAVFVYRATKPNTITYAYSQTAKPVFHVPKHQVKARHFSQTSYSSYYDWLHQKETIVAKANMTNTHSLAITNKHLLITQPQKKIAYPLHTINKIHIAFKRLLLPLITGGIAAPLFGIGLWNQFINFWFGLGIVMLSLSLLYYGWLGTHQISIELQSQHQIHYFADQKTPELKNLIAKTNQTIQQRNQMLRE